MSNSYSVPCIYPKRPVSAAPLSAQVPGSKSITNRAMLLATMADGTSLLKGVLFSDDSRHFLRCIQELGFETLVDEAEKSIQIKGCGGTIPKREASLYVGSAGTAARFLTAYLGVSEGVYHMDASEQMRRRPMAPLLTSLAGLGCRVTYDKEEGCFPFVLKGSGFKGDIITVNINDSSQFLSALLIASVLSEHRFSIHVEGSHGMSYIQMTQKMMAQFGVTAAQPEPGLFTIDAGQRYSAGSYQIEPDASAACYFYALAPLLNIPVLVPHISMDSLQGDIAFLYVLEKMGCTLELSREGILLLPPETGTYQGVTVDLSACSDQAITLAAIAPYAQTPTTISGIGHIRFQECDRLTAIVCELRKMGIICTETESSITIYPGTPKASEVDTYEDHRMAMGFTLTGLRTPGIVIRNPECCSKTFENYFQVMEDALHGSFA